MINEFTKEMNDYCMKLVLEANVPTSYREAVKGHGICLGLTVMNTKPVLSRWNEPAW